MKKGMRHCKKCKKQTVHTAEPDTQHGGTDVTCDECGYYVWFPGGSTAP